MKTIQTPLIAFAGMALLGSALSAATVWNGNANDGDLFGTATNWDSGLPGTGDATIDNGDTVDLSTNYTTTIDRLIVDGNSTLDASADFAADKLVIKDTGTVNLSGGAFTLQRLTGPGNGSGLNINKGGTLEISGGTHSIDERTVVNGTFRVDGSAASISMHQMTVENPVGGATGVFDFVFDAGGISTITGVGSFPWFSIANATVTVDASAVVGIVASYTLFDCDDAGTIFTADKVTVDPSLGIEGVDWNLVITEGTTGRDTVVLNVIPEPGTYALLGGLLALGHVMLRRRRA